MEEEGEEAHRVVNETFEGELVEPGPDDPPCTSPTAGRASTRYPRQSVRL